MKTLDAPTNAPALPATGGAMARALARVKAKKLAQ